MPMTMVLTDNRLYGWYQKSDVEINGPSIPVTTDMRAPEAIVRHKRNIGTILSHLSQETATQLRQGEVIHVNLTRAQLLEILSALQIG